MPKKVNEKVESAREREAAKKTAAQEKAAKDAEDAYWKSAGEGDKGKAGAKREEEERKRLEAAAKRAELKRLAEAEEAALTATKAKATVAGVSKMTKHQLEKQRELDERLREEEAQERAMAAKRELDEATYTKAIVGENINRALEGVVAARSVEGALAALTVQEPDGDKHPEKRMKAAWKAYEERQLPILKQDKPGLKMSQYKDMLWKSWQKAPDNPLNAPALAK
ncbi:hypothetical protein V8C86DRAFT_2529547 [Haematococcus lacustris]